jgi:NTE family protein
MGAPVNVMSENSIVITFSGGGLRAAAFAHGVLTALETVRTPEGDLLDDVAVLSSVSGSSLTAAFYGLNGRDGLKRFRETVLLPGFESGLRLSLFSPANLVRLLNGGLNVREDFGDVLDSKVFHGATFADLYRNPRPSIRIHATDLYHRVPFPFLPALFVVLCSDLTRYPVADAVAASMAVPMVFAPIVIRTYHEGCPPPPREVENLRVKGETSQAIAAIFRAISAYRDPNVNYIKLADGGLTDNYAVSLLTTARIVYRTPYAPMSARDAVRIRRMLVIVVDASRGPSGDWLRTEEGPAGLDLALSATDAAVDSAARLYADAFDDMIEEWQRSVIDYRCSLEREGAIRLGGPADWHCGDVRFTIAHLSVHEIPSPLRERIEAIPTRLTLSADEIDATIEGARAGTLALPQLRAYVRERVRAQMPR